MSHQKVNEIIFKKFTNMFIKKGFGIEVEDAFVYPSSKEVLEAIEKCASKSGEDLDFRIAAYPSFK